MFSFGFPLFLGSTTPSVTEMLSRNVLVHVSHTLPPKSSWKGARMTILWQITDNFVIYRKVMKMFRCVTKNFTL